MQGITASFSYKITEVHVAQSVRVRATLFMTVTLHNSRDVVPCLPVCWLFDFGCLLRLGSVRKQFARRFLATPVHVPLE